MSVLATLPSALQHCDRIFSVLQDNEYNPEAFKFRLALLYRQAVAKGANALRDLDGVVDCLRPHLLFPIRPSLHHDELCAFVCDDDNLPNDAGEFRYEWKYFSLGLEWAKDDHVKYPSLPLPVAELSNPLSSGPRRILSLQALWHVFAGFAFSPRPQRRDEDV